MLNCKRDDCVHAHRISALFHVDSEDGNTACCYIIDTGKPRGCPAENCDKYKKWGGRRRSKKNGGTEKI